MADLFLNLGIDFGTSYTKVVVRDTSRDKSWIVIFSSNTKQPSLANALLLTQIGIMKDGTLIGGITASDWHRIKSDFCLEIDFIKMRLANIDLIQENAEYPSDKLPTFNSINLNSVEIIENLCAFYLAEVIKNSKQWICLNAQELVKNQEIEWSANVGVPVKYFDSKAIERFTKVLKMAWLLSESNVGNTDLFTLNDNLNEIRRISIEEDLPCQAIPEIGAAVYSYTSSRSSEPGLYCFFDVGSGTVEGASFLFKIDQGQKSIDFYTGEVEPIGVNALPKRIALNLNKPEIEKAVVEKLVRNGESLLEEIYSFSTTITRPAQVGEFIANKVTTNTHLRVLVEEVHSQLVGAPSIEAKIILEFILCQSLIHKLVDRVIRPLRNKASQIKSQISLRVFLGGGGSQSIFYADTIESTHTAFCQQDASIPKYDFNLLPAPKALSMSNLDISHFHRFSIAYGLSIPELELPEVTGFPKQFPDKPQAPLKQGWTPLDGKKYDDIRDSD